MHKEKLSIKELESILEQMKKAQDEHPKARVYFSTPDYEIRIIYPLPDDMKYHKTDIFPDFNI